jgi:hypothetical protein
MTTTQLSPAETAGTANVFADRTFVFWSGGYLTLFGPFRTPAQPHELLAAAPVTYTASTSQWGQRMSDWSAAPGGTLASMVRQLARGDRLGYSLALHELASAAVRRRDSAQPDDIEAWSWQMAQEASELRD